MKKDTFDYQWEYLYSHRTPEKDIHAWPSSFGPIVLHRHEDGRAQCVKFQLLLDNRNLEAYLVGDFNHWGADQSLLGEYKLQPDDHGVIASIERAGLTHRTEYKFLIKDALKNETCFITDPAASYFSDSGNAVFWDFEDPGAYKMAHSTVDNFERATKIIQTDLPGLITHFANKEGICGKDVSPCDYYRFVAESGVLPKLKELGFTAVQFLPFAQSIDGDNWKLRYLVPFQYAIQKNWGTPDDFARMVDACHAEGLAVIGDFVLGHLPDRNFKIFGQSDQHHGIHLWKKADGTPLYIKDETSWGSRRIDFDNPFVRQFFIGSTLHFLKNYRIDGFRIDNIDGILRYGDSGDGPDRPNGRTFLRELNAALYSYNPSALIHYEAHYYHGDNAKMLVAPLSSDPRALGATAYNSSRLTYDFHTKYMFLASEQYSVWRVKHITEEQEWGKSNSTVADFHNHDAAAGLMDMRCTGSYAYDAMLALNEHNHVHAVGKIKVMEAIISFGCEGRTLDLLQTFLLQTGTFEHDSSIQWHLTFNEINAAVVRYKQRVNEILDNAAFWPTNVHNRKFLNVDDTNKVLIIERASESSRYIIVINLSAWKLHTYKVGLTTEKNMCVTFNSDELQYGGFGLTSFPHALQNMPSTHFELLSREVELPLLPPYTALVLVEE